MTAYDQAKTRQLLTIAGAHYSNPAAEYIEAVVEQLRGAEAAMVEAASARLKAEGEANRYAAELESAHATIRRLREAREQVPATPPAAPAEPKKRRAKAAEVAPAAPAAAVAPTAPEVPAPAPAKRTRKKVEAPNSQ